MAVAVARGKGTYALLPFTALYWTRSYYPQHTSGGSQVGQITKKQAAQEPYVIVTSNIYRGKVSYEIGHDA